MNEQFNHAARPTSDIRLLEGIAMVIQTHGGVNDQAQIKEKEEKGRLSFTADINNKTYHLAGIAYDTQKESLTINFLSEYFNNLHLPIYLYLDDLLSDALLHDYLERITFDNIVGCGNCTSSFANELLERLAAKHILFPGLLPDQIIKYWQLSDNPDSKHYSYGFGLWLNSDIVDHRMHKQGNMEDLSITIPKNWEKLLSITAVTHQYSPKHGSKN